MTIHSRAGRWCATTFVTLVGVAAIAGVPVAAELAASRADADSLQRKILAMVDYSQSPMKGARLTPVSESEVNSYLRLELAERLPTGVTDPSVSLAGEGRVTGRAVVDLDAVRQSEKRGWLDPVQYLSGRLPVTAQGVLSTQNGLARLELESADVSGVPIPKVLLQKIVTYYSRSPEYPSGVDLDAPFPLPARISEIHVNSQQVVVVQQ